MQHYLRESSKVYWMVSWCRTAWQVLTSFNCATPECFIHEIIYYLMNSGIWNYYEVIKTWLNSFLKHEYWIWNSKIISHISLLNSEYWIENIEFALICTEFCSNKFILHIHIQYEFTYMNSMTMISYGHFTYEFINTMNSYHDDHFIY